MSVFWAGVIVVAVSALSAAAMLGVRRRAPEGSVFADGDRAAGVFGVLATGFSVMLGLIVFLAFSSYDQSRSGAETEALLVAQQYETAQFMPVAVRAPLGGEIVCYARSVVHQEWPKLQNGTEVEGYNPWGVAMFQTLKTVLPRTTVEVSAYDKWQDRRADREQARSDRIHGAVGVIPGPLWIVLLFITLAIFAYMLFFADSAERWYAQAMLMASVMALITATLLLIQFLNHPMRDGYGGLQPVAMARTLRTLEQERGFSGDRSRPPCDVRGNRT